MAVSPFGCGGVSCPCQLSPRHGAAPVQIGIRHIPVINFQFRTHGQFHKRSGSAGDPGFPVAVIDPDRKLRCAPGGTVQKDQPFVFSANRNLFYRIRKNADFLSTGKSNQTFPVILLRIDDLKCNSMQNLFSDRKCGEVVIRPLSRPAADRGRRIVTKPPVAELRN